VKEDGFSWRIPQARRPGRPGTAVTRGELVVGYSVNYRDYHFAKEVDLAEIASRLSEYGQLSSDAGLGVRFEPDTDEWPSTYFGPDGSIHLITRRMGLSDVTDYIGTLAHILDTQIVEEIVHH
jgi:hypothetical protein